MLAMQAEQGGAAEMEEEQRMEQDHGDEGGRSRWGRGVGGSE